MITGGNTLLIKINLNDKCIQIILSFWPRDSQADGCELVTWLQLQQ